LNVFRCRSWNVPDASRRAGNYEAVWAPEALRPPRSLKIQCRECVAKPTKKSHESVPTRRPEPLASHQNVYDFRSRGEYRVDTMSALFGRPSSPGSQNVLLLLPESTRMEPPCGPVPPFACLYFSSQPGSVRGGNRSANRRPVGRFFERGDASGGGISRLNYWEDTDRPRTVQRASLNPRDAERRG
jgi:hypothetical protein